MLFYRKDYFIIVIKLFQTEHETKLNYISLEVVKALGCDKFSEDEEVKCLKNISAEEIIKVQGRTSYPIEHGALHAFMPWTPVGMFFFV